MHSASVLRGVLVHAVRLGFVWEEAMDKTTWTAICATGLCVASSARSAETVTYTYDVFGRLRQVQIAGGPGNGVQRTFEYDATDNRTQIQVSGSSSSGSVTITAQSGVANATTAGVAIGINISGATAPTGMVTFTENGVFLGSAFVYDGQASVFLEGFPLGTHTILASYSGDAANAPYSYTFTIKVQSLGWLPGVLELLLSN
jgi:YD repeat-containing protein